MEYQTLGRRVIFPSKPVYYTVDCRIYILPKRLKEKMGPLIVLKHRGVMILCRYFIPSAKGDQRPHFYFFMQMKCTLYCTCVCVRGGQLGNFGVSKQHSFVESVRKCKSKQIDLIPVAIGAFFNGNPPLFSSFFLNPNIFFLFES